MNGNRQQSITFIHLFPLTFLNLHFLPFLKGQQNLSSGPVNRQDKTPPRSQVIAFKDMGVHATRPASRMTTIPRQPFTAKTESDWGEKNNNNNSIWV